ncbi:glycoside hydrolase family 44 protein [Paenibacillus sp. MBLB4367]|uniref:glycoside hydrolase family 44 protein n=1 Tax=Paenibacillus sp. MBLB4367 TaxID=3384767 RepID=UPI0039082FB2
MFISTQRRTVRLLVWALAGILMMNGFSLLGIPKNAAAAASVETAVDVQASPVAPGSAASLLAKVTASEDASLLVDLEIFDPSLKKVHQAFADRIDVKAGETRTVPFVWNVPPGLSEGEYIVSLGVFGAGWNGMYDWHAGAATLTVSLEEVAFTGSVKAAPETVRPGGTVNVGVTVTSRVYGDALIEAVIIGPDGAKSTAEIAKSRFEAGQERHFAADWTVPQDAKPGDYRVELGAYSPDRSQTKRVSAEAGRFAVLPDETQALPAPESVKAVPELRAIKVTWNEVNGASGYDVEADGIVVPDVRGTSYVHQELLANTPHTYRVRAKRAGAAGVWSEAVTAQTSAPSGTAAVKIFSKTGTSSWSQMPSPGFEIESASGEPIDLSELALRYYFTIEEESPLSIGFWSTVANRNVTTKFVKMPIPSETADHYLEIGFTADAGPLNPGAKAGVYTWMNKENWSIFDHTNDYSFLSSSDYTDNGKVTGYRSGALVWGTEPALFDIPSYPQEVTAVPADDAITVSWQPVAGATGYDVEADGRLVESITGTSYKHDWLSPGTRHSYKVRARAGDKLSIWSSKLSLKTTGEQALPAPSGVRAKPAESSVAVSWSKLAETVTGYEIEVDGVITDAGMQTSYMHEGLASGSQHTYRVRAKDGVTRGIWSALLRANAKFVPEGKFDVTFSVDPSADRAPISPYIYGTNEDLTGTENWTARRMGGNRLSTYNWETNASNAGDDYFFLSDNYVPWFYGGVPWGGNMQEPGIGIAGFHQKSLDKGMFSLVTLQSAGFVANDSNGEVTAAQTAPSSRWVEVKPSKGAPFSLVPNLTDNAVYMDEFVHYLVNKFGGAKTATGIKAYQLDNEPGLWGKTHMYMHPQAPGSAEVADKGIALAKAVKSVDPDAELYGPVSYGFDEMYNMHEAADWNAVKGTYDWYMDYYLDRFRVASLQEGKRLLDALDIHWYPENTAGGYRITDSNSNGNLEANKERMQAPRSLWDPSYTENTWIGQWFSGFLPVIPRLQQSIDTYNPGTKIAISEYNYGGENNVYGGIAQADVLGIFGKYGVHFASFWKMVNGLKEAPYITAAAKLYRNYDGNDSGFGDTKVKAETSDIENSSIYGSVYEDSDNKLHLIVLNKNNDHAMNAVFDLAGANGYTSARVWAFDGQSSAITEREPVAAISGNTFTYEIPKLTACHIVLSAE